MSNSKISCEIIRCWLLLHVAFEPIVVQTAQCYATAIQSTISPNTCMKIVPVLFLAFCYLTCLSILCNMQFLFKLVGGKIKEETILVDFSQLNRSHTVNHQSNFAYSLKVDDGNVLNLSLAILQQIYRDAELSLTLKRFILTSWSMKSGCLTLVP